MKFKAIPDVKKINPNFFVYRLTKENLDHMYELCISNIDYFVLNNILLNEKYLEDNILNVKENRYYLGLYEFGLLLAIIDFTLINDEVNLDFYMIQKCYQRYGISSKIITDLGKYLKTLEYTKINTNILKNDIRALSFCLHNDFKVIKKDNDKIYLRKDLK